MIYKTIVLAGLLHDIGKFLQKGKFGSLDVKGKHPEVSARLVKAFSRELSKVVDPDLLQMLVLKHHESKYFPEKLQVQSAPEDKIPFAYIVCRADNYSSLERGETDGKYQDYKKRPLDSIFSRLEIGRQTPEKLQYHAAEYRPENAFPIAVSGHSESAINKHLRNFGEDFKKIVSSITNFDTFYNQLYSLLLKYTWCIPSNTQEKFADISLFDHLKTTSAISACLYQYHSAINDFSLDLLKDDRKPKFTLLVGDLSGIQGYIFSGSNTGAGAVSKRLRARSFSLAVLTELISFRIIDSFNLPVANILMNSGGKFYILLPNIQEYHLKINQIQKEIDEYLLHELHGEIAFNFAAINMAGCDFHNFGYVVSKVINKLEIKKKRPFSGVIISENNSWNENMFTFANVDSKSLGLCRGCGKEFAVQEVNGKAYGLLCLKDLEIGKKLPSAKWLKFTKSDCADIQIPGRYGVSLLKENPQCSQQEVVFQINENKIYPNINMLTRHMANYVPNDNGQTKSFSEIINEIGASRLAYFKADVDNLGQLFSLGFKGNTADESADSISRVTTFSRMLDLFFSGRVNQLIEKEFPDCYIVFSGGDDLMVIGPWDEIIDFSVKVQKEFKSFTCFNENITLSAGISLAKTKTPVNAAVKNAEDLLEDSKEKVLKCKKFGRNQISIFQRTLSWDDFEDCINQGKQLTKWITAKKLTHSDLWKLKNYDQMFQSFWNNDNVAGLKYHALLAYEIGRKEKENKCSKEVLDWLKSLLNITNPSLINLRVIVDYALCATREV